MCRPPSCQVRQHVDPESRPQALCARIIRLSLLGVVVSLLARCDALQVRFSCAFPKEMQMRSPGEGGGLSFVARPRARCASM